jgi:hypothetical protein
MDRVLAGIATFGEPPLTHSVGITLAATALTLQAPAHLRTTLTLHPFTHRMLRGPRPLMKAGIVHSVRGNDLGAFVCVQGHPADNDGTFRPVEQFDVVARYAPGGLTVNVTGRTGPGRPIRPGYHEGTLEPWSFAVDFALSREALFLFFDVPDHARAGFASELDACA